MFTRCSWIAIVVLILSSVLAVAKNKAEHRTLILNGHTGDITIFMIDGTPFVDLRTLVNIGNGNVAFNGTTIILTFNSPSTGSPDIQATKTPEHNPTPAPQPAEHDAQSHPAPSDAMSADFMSAAVQELGILKEWHAYMAYGITKGVPGDGSRMVLNQNRATEALRQAQVAASTDADRSAYTLLKADFDHVDQWYKTLVEGRKNMTTANYSMSEDPLKNDSQYQKIVACSDFLGTMIPSGTFSDDGSCR